MMGDDDDDEDLFFFFWSLVFVYFWRRRVDGELNKKNDLEMISKLICDISIIRLSFDESKYCTVFSSN